MPKRTTGTKSAATRRHIFETALTAMEERGYQGITIRDICRRAGVSIGTFYRYFPTKSDILRSIYESGDEHMQEEGEDCESKSWYERILAFTVRYAELNAATGIEATRVLYNPENAWFTRIRPMQTKLSALIGGAVRAGELAAEPEELAQTLFILMRGMCYNWCITNGEYPLLERLPAEVARYLSTYRC